MMDAMRHRVLALVLGILAVGTIAAPARADDEAPKVYDGRLEAIQNPGGNGGPRNVTLQSGRMQRDLHRGDVQERQAYSPGLDKA
jgi:hypothetical protein